MTETLLIVGVAVAVVFVAVLLIEGALRPVTTPPITRSASCP
jgi:hypothetical protein